jgi:esterase/lipase
MRIFGAALLGLTALAPSAVRAQAAPEPAAAKVAALERTSSSCPSYGPLPDAPSDYAQAVAAFARYRASKETGIRGAGDLPFLRVHGGPAADSVLLVHGLTDSPYYVATLGDALYARGYNVVSVLLPGHGTAPECLLHVKYQQWENEVSFGLSLARRLGGRVSMAGFSTGGALSLNAIAENFAASNRDPIPWGNVLLFSPAIGFDDKELALCDVPGVDDIVEKLKPWARDNPNAPESNPNKYAKMATNSVCQLYYVTQANSYLSGIIGRDIKARGIGVFAVESMADTTVSPEAVVSFMGSLPSGTRKELITYPKSEKIQHADVPRPETNPHYADMISALDAFLVAPAAATPPSAPPAPSSAEILRRAVGAADALAP